MTTRKIKLLVKIQFVDIPSSKKCQITYKDEKGVFQMMELSFVKEAEDAAVMKDIYGTRYSVTNGVNADGMLIC